MSSLKRKKRKLDEAASTDITKKAKTKTVHKHVSCNNCGETVVGTRFKCMECLNFDLCEDCVSERIHDGSHPFVATTEHMPFELRKPLTFAGWNEQLKWWAVTRGDEEGDYGTAPKESESSEFESETTPMESSSSSKKVKSKKSGSAIVVESAMGYPYEGGTEREVVAVLDESKVEEANQLVRDTFTQFKGMGDALQLSDTEKRDRNGLISLRQSVVDTGEWCVKAYVLKAGYKEVVY